jgi:hypothetical protein
MTAATSCVLVLHANSTLLPRLCFPSVWQGAPSTRRPDATPASAPCTLAWLPEPAPRASTLLPHQHLQLARGRTLQRAS